MDLPPYITVINSTKNRSFLISSDELLTVFNTFKPLPSVSNDVIINFFFKDLSERCFHVQKLERTSKAGNYEDQSTTSIELFKVFIKVRDTFLCPVSLK